MKMLMINRKSSFEMHSVLQNQESINIIQQVVSDSNVLPVPEEAKAKVAPPVSVYSGSESTEFAFNFELVNTVAYRRALASLSKPTPPRESGTQSSHPQS